MQQRNYVENLPGRHYIPDRMLVSLLDLHSTEDLKKCLSGSFAMDWKEQLSAVERGEKASRRPVFFPTAAVRKQNGTADGGSKRRRSSQSSSVSSSPPSVAPLPWKYNFSDMWHVVGIFEANGPVLAAALALDIGDCDSDDEEDNLKAFLSSLDSQIAGNDRRPANVGAICAATSAEWKADRQGRVLQTAREFIALGYLSGGSWPHVSRSSFGYTGPAGITSTRTKSGSSTTGTWASSSFASPPPSLPRTTHLTWRAVPRRFHPESIASDKEGLRVAMLLELLLSNDTRGQAPGESDVKYETHLLKLIHSEFHGTGVKMPVNLNRGRALFSMPELRQFMAIIFAGDERAVEVSNGCLTAVAALRSSSLNSASDSFPFGSIPPRCTMLRALKAVNSALAALGESESSGDMLLAEEQHKKPKLRRRNLQC